ncbi:protease inhibitor-like [Drosophila novamexicana]|uniref:protease inhibitor-like n=1 Tax=Drosophila novamexicana TaxID=47314 RepID=UPI0011E5AC78|nr:protease inhibitor-like [Drosophila novamexicana]
MKFVAFMLFACFIAGNAQSFDGRCYKKPLLGNICRAGTIQWYYQINQNRCKEFLWGGCRLTIVENRFDTREECVDSCSI